MPDYSILKKNVDELKIIQVGLTLFDSNGNMPEVFPTWQFNFKFDDKKDKHNTESIDMLKSYGINFNLLQSQGISMEKFGELLITSGLILNENVRWISFHGSYDFAYLLKIVTGQQLPPTINDFQKDLELYFTNFFDIRVIVKPFENLSRCSLQRLAFELGISRIGIQHQAGSDSLLTGDIFFKIKRDYVVEYENDVHKLFGYEIGSDEGEYGYSNYQNNQYLQKSQYDYNVQQTYLNLNQINYNPYIPNNMRNGYAFNNYYAPNQFTPQGYMGYSNSENTKYQQEGSKVAEEVKKKKVIMKGA